MAYLSTNPEGAAAVIIPVQSIDRTKRVYAENGRTRGRIIGGGDHCRLEGCPGIRVSVRWPNGTLTRPCTEGLWRRKDGHYQIG